MSGWITIISTVLGAAVGAAVIVFGNHYLQRGVVRRHRSADDLKNRLYEFLDLAARYWTDAGSEPRSTMEARILASWTVIASECDDMTSRSQALRGWYRDTGQARRDLLDAVTGGRFQQTDWIPDPVRATRAAKHVVSIASKLDRAC